MSIEVLRKQIENHALKRGEFTLASGKKSHYYLDLKLAYTRPEVMKNIVKELVKSSRGIKFDSVGGMELGAVPIAVAVSMNLRKPFVIIRKEKKSYGAGNRIEGELKESDQVLLIEDVVTTGASLVSAADAVRKGGGICNVAIAVVDRMEGAKENLQKINIGLIPLITAKDMGL